MSKLVLKTDQVNGIRKDDCMVHVRFTGKNGYESKPYSYIIEGNDVALINHLEYDKVDLKNGDNTSKVLITTDYNLELDPNIQYKRIKPLCLMNTHNVDYSFVDEHGLVPKYTDKVKELGKEFNTMFLCEPQNLKEAIEHIKLESVNNYINKLDNENSILLNAPKIIGSKYSLTGESKNINIKNATGEKSYEVYQIKALKDFGDIKAGDIGGWISDRHNLSHRDKAWVHKDAIVVGNSRITKHAQIVSGIVMDSNITDKTKVFDGSIRNCRIGGNSTIKGKVYHSDIMTSTIGTSLGCDDSIVNNVKLNNTNIVSSNLSNSEISDSYVKNSTLTDVKSFSSDIYDSKVTSQELRSKVIDQNTTIEHIFLHEHTKQEEWKL